MKTANVTYYGSGHLSLQHRRFPSRKTVSARLDDILPSERKRFASKLLITDPDGQLINIGVEVPVVAALEAINHNGRVLKESGFAINLPPGWVYVDTPYGVQVMPAGELVGHVTELGASESGSALEPEPLKELTKPPPCPHDTDGDGNCGQKMCPNCNPKVAEAMKEMAEDYSMRPESNLAAAFNAAEAEAASVTETVPAVSVPVDAVAEAAAEAAAEALMPKDAPKKGGKKNKQKKGESLADLL